MSRFRAKRHFSSNATVAAPVPVPRREQELGELQGPAAHRRGLPCPSRRPVASSTQLEADRLRHLGEDQAFPTPSAKGWMLSRYSSTRLWRMRGPGETRHLRRRWRSRRAGPCMRSISSTRSPPAKCDSGHSAVRGRVFRRDGLGNVVHRRGVVAVGSGPVGCHVLVCDASHEMGIRAPHRLQASDCLAASSSRSPSQGCEPSGRATKPSIEMPHLQHQPCHATPPRLRNRYEDGGEGQKLIGGDSPPLVQSGSLARPQLTCLREMVSPRIRWSESCLSEAPSMGTEGASAHRAKQKAGHSGTCT